MGTRRMTKLVSLVALTVAPWSSAARGQDNSVQQTAPPAAAGTYYPEYNYNFDSGYHPHWRVYHAPLSTYFNWRSSNYHVIQPGDWGCGPYGPRHNLNATQMSPSGMSWW
jgi:hypothetical protein